MEMRNGFSVPEYCETASLRIFQHPDHAREHGGSDLQAGRVLIWGQIAGFLDGQLIAAPESILCIAV